MADSSTKKLEIGEIARNKQFLLFPTVSSKDLFCRQVKTWACSGKAQE